MATILASLALASSASAAIPFCLPGEGPGQCKEPKGVATDWETGHVYVVDQGNHLINVFKSDGTFLFSFGPPQLKAPTWVAVDNDKSSASHHDVYVSADNFEVQKFTPAGEFVKSFGGEGKGVCQLMSTQDPVAVGPKGDVFVADSYDKDGKAPEGPYVNRVQHFDSEGKCLGEVGFFEGQHETIRDLAVNSSGDFYVSVAGAGGVIRRYSPTGSFIADLGGIQTEGLSVDAADNVFGKQRTSKGRTGLIAEYAPDNSLIKRFGYTEGLGAIPSTSLAVLEGEGGAEGAFATEQNYVPVNTTQVNFLPVPKGPVIVPQPCHVKNDEPGSVRATLQAEVNAEGKATTFKFEYLTQAKFVEEGGFSGAQSSAEESLPLESPEERAKREEEGKEFDEEEALFNLHEAALTVTGLEPETSYRCRVVAKNSEGTTPPGEEGSFETKEGFQFGPGLVSGVGQEAVTVTAEGNPLGLPATAQVEYVTDAKFKEDRFAQAQTSPVELEYGAGETMQAREAVLTGLTPSTTYHWRLHVKNGVPLQGIFCPRSGPEPCPANEHVFRTYGPEEGADERAWELVSPAQKNSAELVTFIVASGVNEARFPLITASSGSGEVATYPSFTSFGKEAEEAPPTSQYVSKRTPSGWVTDNVSPLGRPNFITETPYKGFTADLDFMGFYSNEALAPGCTKGPRNFYLLDTTSGERTCLTAEAPAPNGSQCFNYAGSSEDGSRAFFASGSSYAGVPAIEGFSLYQWTAAGGLKPLSVLPGQSEPAVPTQGTSLGRSLSSNAIENCQYGQTMIRHAISADGSRVFWTYVPEVLASLPEPPGVQKLTLAGSGTFTLTFQQQVTQPVSLEADAATIQKALESLSTIGPGNVEVSGSDPFTITFKGSLAGTSDRVFAKTQAPTQLLARLNNTETVQLDAKPAGQKTEKPGAGPFGNGVFRAASKDGSVVYFTAGGKLIQGSKAEGGAFSGDAGKPDLYRYEFGKAEPLSDLTRTAVLPADVQGVVGASEDGSYIYFVAGGALSGEEEGPSGEKAVQGAHNLYLYHAGKTSFVARLSGADQFDWEAQPKYLSARVSPDGKHLAFLSEEAPALVGYNNTIAGGVLPCHTEGKEKGLIGGPICPQGFVYDVEADRLSCATCNPTGARPVGPAALPGWTNGLEGPRFLSDDGSRFFFESYDRLLKADENKQRDVYEFERPGTGSCTTTSANFDPAAEGCHYLVSNGKSEDQSFLVDGSSDGRDVFFATRAALVGWDPNENFDVYDYREGGGFPEPSERQPCLGEACKGPANAAPTPASAITPNFFDAGNPVSNNHGRHKHHHKAKKKKSHAKKKKSHARKKGASR